MNSTFLYPLREPLALFETEPLRLRLMEISVGAGRRIYTRGRQDCLPATIAGCRRSKNQVTEAKIRPTKSRSLS